MNYAGKTQVWSSLLKTKEDAEFQLAEAHQRAFEGIKYYLSTPPILMPPKRGRNLKLYISSSESSIGSMLAQDNDTGLKQAVYNLSRILTPVEQFYAPIERLCLSLYFASQKLRAYMLPVSTYIICQTDVIKYMLSRPIMRGRIGKSSLALMKFSLQY